MIGALPLSLSHALVGGFVILVLLSIFSKGQLDHIPSLGHSYPFLRRITAFQYLLGFGKKFALEGYRKFGTTPFKFAVLGGGDILIVNDTEKIEEMRRASEDVMDAESPIAWFFQFDYTLGPRFMANPYHLDVIKTSMTRNIGARFAEIHEEVVNAYREGIPESESNNWVALSAYAMQLDVITKVSSRYFVGEPLCRNAELRSICEKAAIELFKSSFIRWAPTFLRGPAANLFTSLPKFRRDMEELIRPIVEYRFEQERVHGPQWDDKPNDLISWLIDGARAAGEGIDVSDLASRIIFISFAAIHTSSASVTSAIFELCLAPNDAEEIRKEVRKVIEEDGWSKAALGKMHKLDSFLRESQRFHFVSIFTMGRLLKKDYTFADGTFIPKGIVLSVNAYARHRDEALYEDGQTFKGFRYVPVQPPPPELEGKVPTCASGVKQQQRLAVTPTPDYLGFGCGKGACPGRFFAVAEMKTMLAHLLLNYEINLEDPTRFPKKIVIETNSLPNMRARILIRKRRSGSG